MQYAYHVVTLFRRVLDAFGIRPAPRVANASDEAHVPPLRQAM
jgi:hypothetical protein